MAPFDIAQDERVVSSQKCKSRFLVVPMNGASGLSRNDNIIKTERATLREVRAAL